MFDVLLSNNRFLSKTNPEILKANLSGSNSNENPKFIQESARQMVDAGLWDNLKLWTNSQLLTYSTTTESVAFEQTWNTQPYGVLNCTTSVSASILRVTSSNNDPSINMSSLGSFDPNTYKWIEIKYQITSGSAGVTQIFYYNSRRTSANADQVVNGPNMFIDSGGYRITEIYMGNHQYWTHSNITGWRYDVSTTRVNMNVDYIKLKSSPLLNEIITLYDISGNGNHLTGSAAPKYLSNEMVWDWPGGGQAATGTSGSGQGSGFTLQKRITNTQQFTTMCWVKVKNPNPQPVNTRLVSEHGPTLATTLNYDFIYGTDELFALSYRDSTNTSTLQTPSYTPITTINNNQWYHTAISWGSDNIPRIYVNGTLEVTGSVYSGTRPTGSSITCIGHRFSNLSMTDGRALHTGSLDDVRIFNIELTQPQIDNIFQLTKGYYGY